jgi:dTDP-4-dehydrorhamnose 3,5-epimerase
MKISDVFEVSGMLILEQVRHADNRGFFQELFSAAKFNMTVRQINMSRSGKGVLRGLHVVPFAKLCSCISGKMFDVVADVRPESDTYGKWFGTILEAESSHQVYVPPGCAHGFLALEDDTTLLYAQDGVYDPSREMIVNWADPTLMIDWPGGFQFIVSQKDSAAPFIKN